MADHIIFRYPQIYIEIDHVLGHKTCLNKLKRTEITPIIFSDDNAIKLKNKKKVLFFSPPRPLLYPFFLFLFLPDLCYPLLPTLWAAVTYAAVRMQFSGMFGSRMWLSRPSALKEREKRTFRSRKPFFWDLLSPLGE